MSATNVTYPYIKDYCENMMRAAEQGTGLYDWGEINMTAVEVTAEIHLRTYLDNPLRLPFRVGRDAIIMSLLEVFKTRLIQEEFYQRHLDHFSNPIIRPMLVTGFPRTGSTLLLELLCQDPENRFVRRWEMKQPIPPKFLPSGDDPREVEALKSKKPLFRLLSWLTKETILHKIHYEEPNGPTEDIGLLKWALFPTNSTISPYPKNFWGLSSDGAFKIYKKLLKIILGTGIGNSRLVSKGPGFSAHIPTYLKTFPDACIVLIHRDPLSVVGSDCSRVWNARRVLSPNPDPKLAGSDTLEALMRLKERMIVARQSLPNEAFVDVYYNDMLGDPAGVVEQVYHRWGYHFSGAYADNIRAYIKAHPQHHRGKHQYQLADFGIKEREVRDSFEDYAAAFDLAM